jgi:pimeloyl-ACP methyl ester carboxylesterase
LRTLSVLVLTLAAAGCHGGGPRPAASVTVTSRADTAACPGQPGDAKPVTLTTDTGLNLAAVEMGSGTKGVLLVPEAGASGMCGWMAYASELAAKGLRVMTFDMPCQGASTCPSASPASGPASGSGSEPGFGKDGLSAVATALSRFHYDGVKKVVLVGASAGATTALAALTSLEVSSAPGVRAVVALSADELGDLPAKASSIYVPTLMAVADGDRYVSTVDERKLFDTLGAPASIKALDVRPSGAGHGWDLLGDQGFKGKVTDFIAAQLADDYTVWGTGSRTIVLSNQSDEDQTSWQAYADHLVGKGYRVVMWDYGQDPVQGLAAVVADLRAHGSGPLFLIGASEGGKASLVAAADLRPPATAVVTLSAEAVLLHATDVSSYVKRLTCPVLLLTSAQDRYGSADAAKTFQADLPNLARTVVYDGADHGTLLLSGSNGPTVIADIDAFLAAH